MKDWRYALAEQRGTLLAFGIFALMFAIYASNHPAGLTANVVQTASNKGVLLAFVAMAQTLVARGYRIVSGGTQNHLMLVDMIGKDVSGKDAEAALGRAHITVNKNSVPNDPRSPFVTSGLRLGTPAVTTRGYTEQDCVDLAHWIADVLDAPADESVIAAVRAKVTAQCAKYPVYG